MEVTVVLLTEQYKDQIAGILSCYDRIIAHGTVPDWCFAQGMTSFLYANKIKIFDYPPEIQSLEIGCSQAGRVHSVPDRRLSLPALLRPLPGRRSSLRDSKFPGRQSGRRWGKRFRLPLLSPPGREQYSPLPWSFPFAGEKEFGQSCRSKDGRFRSYVNEHLRKMGDCRVHRKPTG